MSRSLKKPWEITRKDYEKMQERYWRRLEPYLNRLQAEWILKELDARREAAKGLESTNEDD